MTRPTTIIGLAGLVIVGVIVADFLTHPKGVTAGANGINGLTKTSTQALLGK